MSALVESRTARLDPVLIGGIVGLIVIGTIMVASASISIAADATGQPFYYLVRHAAALGIGLTAAVCIVALPSRIWNDLSGWIVLLSMIGLVLVFVPGLGLEKNGSTRWLALGPLRLQPSEFARIGLIIYLASYSVRHYDGLSNRLSSLIKPLLFVVLAVALLLLEPDYGSAAVVTATSLGILFVGGSRIRDVALSFSAAAGVFALAATMSPYRWERFLNFRHPFDDPYDKGYQLANALIGIGRGDWFGAGLGESVQKLYYLPEPHTDFVFAVFAEEFGFVGSTLVIALFAIVVYRTLVIGRRAINAGLSFQGLLCTGIGLMIGIEAGVNIGVNIGMLPTKGLTLPLMSYGRSSLVATLIGVALVVRVYHELLDAEARAARRKR